MWTWKIKNTHGNELLTPARCKQAGDSWRAAKPGRDRRTLEWALVNPNTLQWKFDIEEFRLHIILL